MNYSFMPNSERASALQILFKTQLKQSFQEMLEQVQVAQPVFFHSVLVEKFADTPISQYNGFFSFVYHYSIQVLSESRFDEAVRAMECLFHGNYQNLVGCVDSSRVDPVLKTTMYSGAVLGTSYANMRLRDLGFSETKIAVENMNIGVFRLEDAIPQLAGEISALIDSIVFFESGGETTERALSFTSNRCQSLIFLNGSYKPTWVFLLDKLVHEAAHTYLFAVNLQEELLSNSAGAEFSSPLRNDKRTLIAIYHATFVIERLILCFSMVAGDTSLTEEDSREIAGLLDFYHSRLDAGYNVILEHGRLTDCGFRLLREGREFALDAKR